MCVCVFSILNKIKTHWFVKIRSFFFFFSKNDLSYGWELLLLSVIRVVSKSTLI